MALTCERKKKISKGCQAGSFGSMHLVLRSSSVEMETVIVDDVDALLQDDPVPVVGSLLAARDELS